MEEDFCGVFGAAEGEWGGDCLGLEGDQFLGEGLVVLVPDY